MDTSELMPEGFVITKSKYLGSKWETEYLAQNDISNDNDVKQVHAEFRAKYTVTVNFDFTNVSVQEMAQQLCSTTSFSKMLYNNELKNWSESEAEKLCKKPFECKIRTLLDARKTRTLSPEEATKRGLKRMREKGATKEQILAMLEDLE